MDSESQDLIIHVKYARGSNRSNKKPSPLCPGSFHALMLMTGIQEPSSFARGPPQAMSPSLEA